jgi:dTMP kinase
MFIVFEGIDGSGKTALSKAYAADLERRGVPVFWTCEPTYEGVYGSKIRAMLAGKGPPATPPEMAMLFALDRLDHVERVINPMLALGMVVVCDRYISSNVAYQGSLKELHGETRAQWLGWIFLINVQAPPPDKEVYLRARPEVIQLRLAARGGSLELYEKNNAHRMRTLAIYESMKFDVEIATSDASLDECLATLRERLGV